MLFRSGSGDQSWIHDPTRLNKVGCTLDLAKFVAAPDTIGHGCVLSGVALGKVTATGLFAPYNGLTDEVQTLTEGGSGLTSWTATYSGQTTGSLDDDATPAQVQAALEALSTIGAGNVVVTGTTAPIAMTVKFVGALADTNTAALTTTPTGGSGTVDVATTTAGGAAGAADGTQVFWGLLFDDVPIPAGAVTGNLGASRVVGGVVRTNKLPVALGPGAVDTPALTTQTGLTGLIFTEGA